VEYGLEANFKLSTTVHSCEVLEMKGIKNHGILELQVMQIIQETP
jgi:hypothetical protein